jgi:prepilin-type N-terminal cleavage/methylation domain-containing protein
MVEHCQEVVRPSCKTDRSGVTLVELLCVVAMISILLCFYTGAIQSGYRYSVDTLKKVIKEWNERHAD